jgi:hypothetical protein
MSKKIEIPYSVAEYFKTLNMLNDGNIEIAHPRILAINHITEIALGMRGFRDVVVQIWIQDHPLEAVRAFMDGYVVTDQQRAYQLPSGQYVKTFNFDSYQNLVSFAFSDEPVWLDPSAFEVIPKYVEGRIVKENEIDR